MKSINSFKAGAHTSYGGITLDFSDDVLQASASAYDPAIHEAPVVIGHPADNGPALGWICALRYAEGEQYAAPDQVNGEFEDWYRPDFLKKSRPVSTAPTPRPVERVCSWTAAAVSWWYLPPGTLMAANKTNKSAPACLSAQRACLHINHGEGAVQGCDVAKQYRIGGGFRVRKS